MNPFHIIQIYAIIVWFIIKYTAYASVILVLGVVTITLEVVQTKLNLRKLRIMASYFTPVKVLRDNRWEEIKSKYLVPGDIITIPEGVRMPCDAILIQGQSIVNEAMLTGESVPILKQCLHRTEKESYDPETDKKHTLFSGTEVIRTRAGAEKALGLVTKTGYDTTKGLLVKSILFPRPSKFKFH